MPVDTKLKSDIEHERLVTILKRIPIKVAVAALSERQMLDCELIERFVDQWDWEKLSRNKILSWSIELIERFVDRWDWRLLSENRALPWSSNLIERFDDRWDWTALSQNDGLPWSNNLIERFVDHWEWRALSESQGLPWSAEFIDQFSDHWYWGYLSSNDALPWSIELIERFADCWEWEDLSESKALPWSIELIERFVNRWDWRGSKWCRSEYEEEREEEAESYRMGRRRRLGLNGNEALPWSIELIESFIEHWDWEKLTRNEALPWSIHLMERFEVRWDWKGSKGVARQDNSWSDGTNDGDDVYGYFDRGRVGVRRGICGNNALPWSIGLIERFVDRWNWMWLSKSEHLPWSIEMIERFSEHWDLNALSTNFSLIWSPELIERLEFEFQDQFCSSDLIDYFRDVFDEPDSLLSQLHNSIKSRKNGRDWVGFGSLSKRTDLSWSLELIERYQDCWDWEALSKNKALPWSINLIEIYETRWDWSDLTKNIGLPWSVDIIERFVNQWDWISLNVLLKHDLILPLLSTLDIVEIMMKYSSDSGPLKDVDLSDAKILAAPMVSNNLDPDAQSRFIALKIWRAEIARKMNLPWYAILQNSTLVAIAQRRPISLVDLRGIGGIGGRQIEAYGEAMLKVIWHYDDID